MALAVNTLTTQMQAVATTGLAVPPAGPTRDAQAEAYADAYQVYAAAAVSCAALGPTLVNLSTLKSQLRDAFALNPSGFDEPADAWANAFSAYWTGAVFGTGTVTVPGVPTTLSSGLSALWSASQAQSPAPTALGVIASMASLIDSFTRGVVVNDPSIPCTAAIT